MEIWGTLAYLAVLIGIMYLVLFLPQRKREKKIRAMLNSLEVGNIVVTIGGICGKIINIKDDDITIETSVERTQILFKRWAIKEIVKPVES